jgi:hypothetical protein
LAGHFEIVRPLQRDHELRIEESERDDVHRHIAGGLARESFDAGGSDCGHDHLEDENDDVGKPKGLTRDPAFEIPEKSYPLHGGGGGTLRLAALGRRGHRQCPRKIAGRQRVMSGSGPY